VEAIETAEVSGLERDARTRSPRNSKPMVLASLSKGSAGKNMRPALLATVEKPDNGQAAGIATVARGLEFSPSGNENRLRF
jgi:hypothetical protein